MLFPGARTSIAAQMLEQKSGNANAANPTPSSDQQVDVDLREMHR
jgi:hypothetical protein